MEDLPLEVLGMIEQNISSPTDLLSLTEATPGFRDVLPSVIPLSLPSGYLLPWDKFASSSYPEVRGDGSVQAPSDDRMRRASRRTRGNLQLALRVEDPRPRDLVRLLRIRALLYPRSIFRIRGPDGRVIVGWENGAIVLNLRYREWKEDTSEIRRLLQSVPILSLEIDSPDRIKSGLRRRLDEETFSLLLDEYVPYMEGIRTLVVHGFYFPEEAPSTLERFITSDSELYSAPRYKDVREVEIEIGSNFEIKGLDPDSRYDRFSYFVQDLPSLQKVTFRVLEDRGDELRASLREKVERYREHYPSLAIGVEAE